MDDQSVFIGPDKQVPPKRRRGTLVVPGEEGIDDRTLHGGPDKQVPPAL